MLTRGGQRTSKVQWGEPSKYKAGKAGPVHGVAQVAVEWGVSRGGVPASVLGAFV